MPSLAYYDIVLLAIAVSVGVGAGVGVVTPVSLPLAVGLFSLVAVGLIGHALFINGPVDEPEDLTEEVEPEEVPGGAAIAHVVE